MKQWLRPLIFTNLPFPLWLQVVKSVLGLQGRHIICLRIFLLPPLILCRNQDPCQHMTNKIEKNDENGENNVLLFKPSLVMLCYIYICSWSSYFLTCRDTISLLQTNSPFHLWSRSFSSDNGILTSQFCGFLCLLLFYDVVISFNAANSSVF